MAYAEWTIKQKAKKKDTDKETEASQRSDFENWTIQQQAEQAKKTAAQNAASFGAFAASIGAPAMAYTAANQTPQWMQSITNPSDLNEVHDSFMSALGLGEPVKTNTATDTSTDSATGGFGSGSGVGGGLTDAEKQAVTNQAFEDFKQSLETGDWTPLDLLGLNDFSMFDNDRSTPQAVWNFVTGDGTVPDSDVEADLPLAENQNMDYDKDSTTAMSQQFARQSGDELDPVTDDDLAALYDTLTETSEFQYDEDALARRAAQDPQSVIQDFQNLGDARDAYDMGVISNRAGRTYDDDFWGQSGASYTLGKLTEEENLA
ncbi:MAG: hypothetical protein AB7D36_11100, partial [Oscillospiraceae bacterium]